MIEKWHVRQIRCNAVPWALQGGFPAMYLSEEAQWVRGRDPKTGDALRTFVGPTFHGTEIEIDLEAEKGACGLVVTARFEHPATDAPPESPDDVTIIARLVPGPGTYALALQPPTAGRITLQLTPTEKRAF